VVVDTYRSSNNSDERNTALRVLGRARDPELIKETLSLALNGEVREQDIYMPLGGLRSHPEGIEALYNWMTENWDELVRRLPPELSMLDSVVSICTSGFSSQDGLQRIQEFFARKSTKGFDQVLAQSCDAVKAKVAWLDRDRKDVQDWVNSYSAKTTRSDL
jgi:aminopeptidase 2